MITQILDFVRSWPWFFQFCYFLFMSVVLTVCINGLINKFLSFFTFSLPVIIRGWPNPDAPSEEEILEEHEQEK